MVVALLWLAPLSVLLYVSGVDVRHVVQEVPELVRHLMMMFVS
ncbi:hypothetical protein [Burkholderia sp. Ac-20353]|nr:hypothetical protein [Burkholderia sp. Ac-20353]